MKGHHFLYFRVFSSLPGNPCLFPANNVHLSHDPHITLADLPSFRVLAIEPLDDPKLIGKFNHLRSVREGRSWLYAGNEHSLIGDLVSLEPASKQAAFIAPFWEPTTSPVQVGSVVPWLDGYWQAYHITMIVGANVKWRRVEFAASDAQHFKLGTAHGWAKVGQGLPEGAQPTHIQPAGWDHEHCELCNAHIGKGGDPFGHIDAENHWLCEKCYRRYAEPQSLAFARRTSI